MARYFQLELGWDCDLFDKRGDKLPYKLVVDVEKIPGFARAERVKNTNKFPYANGDAIRDCFADWLESKYGFNLYSISYYPVATRRGIPGI